jgi:hypothetical protein
LIDVRFGNPICLAIRTGHAAPVGVRTQIGSTVLTLHYTCESAAPRRDCRALVFACID